MVEVLRTDIPVPWGSRLLLCYRALAPSRAYTHARTHGKVSSETDLEPTFDGPNAGCSRELVRSGPNTSADLAAVSFAGVSTAGPPSSNSAIPVTPATTL